MERGARPKTNAQNQFGRTNGDVGEMVRVEGEPDTERVLAALEWLLYGRGPLARIMRRSG